MGATPDPLSNLTVAEDSAVAGAGLTLKEVESKISVTVVNESKIPVPFTRYTFMPNFTVPVILPLDSVITSPELDATPVSLRYSLTMPSNSLSLLKKILVHGLVLCPGAGLMILRLNSSPLIDTLAGILIGSCS